MEIAYRAQTETCTLLLDANGVCRSVVASPAASRGRPARIPTSAERCIGAQFVASLDFRDPSGLTHLPELGAPMLFARIESDGRITLVRSAKLLAWGPVAQIDSGVRARPEREAARLPDDEELTTPIELDELTIPRAESYRSRASLPPRISRISEPAYAPEPPRASSYPPPRASMKVPITPARDTPRATIPPPAPAHRSSPPIAPRPAALPRRPSLARINPPAYEGPTLPFRRAAR